MALMQARRILVGAALGLAAASGFAQEMQPGFLPPPGEPAAADFSLHIPSATKHAKSIAGQPKYAAGKDWVTVTEQPNDDSGPSAHFKVNDDGKFTCQISMHTVDQVATRMLKDVTTENVLKFREYTLSHEASHCEFNARMVTARRYGEGDQIHGTDFDFQTASRFESQLENHYHDTYKLRDTMVKPTMELVSEGYADTRGLLIMAATDISKAKTPQQRQEALKDFDQFAEQIGQKRRESAYRDLAHDSSQLVSTVRQFVKDKASSTEGLKELQAMSTDHSLASSYAIKWSMADAMQRSHATNRQTLVLAINDVETSENPSLLSRELRQFAKVKDDARAKVYSAQSLGITPANFERSVQWMLVDFQKAYNEAQSPRASADVPSSSAKATQQSPEARVSQVDAAALASRIFSPSFLGQRSTAEASLKRRGPGLS